MFLGPKKQLTTGVHDLGQFSATARIMGWFLTSFIYSVQCYGYSSIGASVYLRSCSYSSRSCWWKNFLALLHSVEKSVYPRFAPLSIPALISTLAMPQERTQEIGLLLLYMVMDARRYTKGRLSNLDDEKRGMHRTWATNVRTIEPWLGATQFRSFLDNFNLANLLWNTPVAGR